MQSLRMLTHHGQYSSSREIAERCVSWMLAVGGEVLGRVGGQFQKQHTHPNEKNEDPCLCGVHTKLEQLNILLKSPGNTLSDSYQFVDDGQDPSVSPEEITLPPPQHRALCQQTSLLPWLG